ncbi:aminopeptidase [Coprococcus eutactus]|uniref:aminopeptidase n=1 Tax=Coprococcus eutactus TaxID=33043 RepID=UPI001D05E021|nr:aminopeptidase [Coprococcus eutactus]MCB6630204.1 aminopeptidase [Coprococcus eutactus]MCG4791394.1 aminopeptidase [Coprococcus eutactus]MCQ5120138.1 aminopeptidase [Coprococcus eutactus]MCQ5134024.1 aminopeptidase [Coprococcus eutactus]MCQ5137174.1 aminopeptidase [Coprococcus eutactus]
MNYYDNFIEEFDDIEERYELVLSRIRHITHESVVKQPYGGYFTHVAAFITRIGDVLELVRKDALSDRSLSQLEAMNHGLYSDILGDNYNKSYANYRYITDEFMKDYSREKNEIKKIAQLLGFVYNEIRGMTVYAFEGRIVDITLLAELFVQIYFMFQDNFTVKELEDVIYYFENDYAEFFMSYRIREQLSPDLTFATDIIMNSDLEDVSYLYKYGEYISKNEIDTAIYLSTFTEEEIESMARTYTEGYRLGFEAAKIDLSAKKTVNIRYFLGQERMVKAAIEQFRAMGLEPICYRYAVSRINRRLISRVGYSSTVPNKQLEYDHRMDEALFLDKKLMERKLEVLRQAYRNLAHEASVYAGPAVIEVFGENPFEPVSCDANPVLDKKQQEIQVEYRTESAQIVNEYIEQDKCSFTIIAYPIPEIGDRYREIFRDTVRINTLDNELFRHIHQNIIDELDKADRVRVVGKGSNETDMLVMLHELDDPANETNFENCVADVNIPVGEVFTSPKLTGTHGILNVSEVYLDGLRYVNLKLKFEDGKIAGYDCDNYSDHDMNQKFIRENLLGGRDTLPIGEFAIGTNTTAYVMANKYNIVYKLPILIVEKMGPHFAVGDTCYSWSEDNKLYNPDGKEIVAKDNECSILRKTDLAKAYFNCHTDITIPYDEIGGIYALHSDGTETAIIEDGRFVLPGTEKLNEPLQERI